LTPNEGHLDTGHISEITSQDVITDVYMLVIKRYRLLFVIGLASALVAYALTFLLTPKYTSTATFVPQSSVSTPSNLLVRGIAQRAGVNTGSMEESPEFYARLLTSRYVRTRVVCDSLQDGGTLLRNYYSLSNSQEDKALAVRRIASSYRVSIDRIPGIVRIDVEMTSPLIARDVALKFLDIVNQYNSQRSRDLGREQEKFFGRRLEQAKESMLAAEDSLRDFLNQNRQIDSPTLEFEKRRLERRLAIVQVDFPGFSRHFLGYN